MDEITQMQDLETAIKAAFADQGYTVVDGVIDESDGRTYRYGAMQVRLDTPPETCVKRTQYMLGDTVVTAIHGATVFRNDDDIVFRFCFENKS